MGLTKPKRAQTAFFLYMGEARDTIKSENPDMAAKEIASEAGRRWKAMSDSEKQGFQDQHEEAKEEYKKAMEEFEANKGSDYESDEKPAKRKRGKKKERDANMPKRPMSGFFLFMNDARPTIKAENPDMAVKEIAAEAGRRWGTMSDSEKQPFTEQYEEAKEEYKKAMEEYEANKTPTKKRARKSKYVT